MCVFMAYSNAVHIENECLVSDGLMKFISGVWPYALFVSCQVERAVNAVLSTHRAYILASNNKVHEQATDMELVQGAFSVT